MQDPIYYILCRKKKKLFSYQYFDETKTDKHKYIHLFHESCHFICKIRLIYSLYILSADKRAHYLKIFASALRKEKLSYVCLMWCDVMWFRWIHKISMCALQWHKIHLHLVSYLLDNVSFLLNRHKYSLKCTYILLSLCVYVYICLRKERNRVHEPKQTSNERGLFYYQAIELCCKCEHINKYMINVFDEMGIKYYRNGGKNDAKIDRKERKTRERMKKNISNNKHPH